MIHTDLQLENRMQVLNMIQDIVRELQTNGQTVTVDNAINRLYRYIRNVEMSDDCEHIIVPSPSPAMLVVGE